MSGQSGWKPKSNPWLIAIVVTLAAFMEVLDTTIVNVALPHISGAMSASYDEATWTLTAYLVSNGIVLPISGFLSKLLGRKRYFLISIAAFTACSLMCGLAMNLYELIFFRVLQGFFGGGLQPNQQSIILDTFPPEQRGKAFSISALAIVVAPVVGPTLGGWITDHLTWRWVFLINVPIGILTTFAVMQFVEDPPWEQKKNRKELGFDFTGIGLITIGLGCLQVFLDRGEDDDWFKSGFIVTFAILSLMGIVGAAYWLLYAKRPVVDLRVLKDRNFVVGCTCMAGFATVLYGSSVLIPQLAQQQLGYTATLAGLILSPGAILIVMLIPFVQRLMLVVQTRFLVGFGFFLLAVAMWYTHQLVPNIDFKTLMLMRSAQSIGIAFLFVPISTLAYTTLSPAQNGDASALFTMFRNVFGSVGISLATAAITARTQANLAHMSRNMTPLNPNYNQSIYRMTQTFMDMGQNMSQAMSTATGQMYKEFIAQSTILAYLDIFTAVGLFSLCFVPLTFLFSPSKASGGGGGH